MVTKHLESVEHIFISAKAMENRKVMEELVKEYFSQYLKDEDLKIYCGVKRKGVRQGSIAAIQLQNSNQSVKYFVKSHRHGN
ncbi:MAG TPA: hypothetical protein PLS50_06790, partial [Candidatus Dojkabacteria bacterium]|nr:hypothetical protein [Candidatus Dojkabacteria bacterium]